MKINKKTRYFPVLQTVEKVNYAESSRLSDKGLGSSPFSKGLADSKGMSLDVLRTSGRTIAMSEISYAERARQWVNCQNSPADCFDKRGRPASEAAP